MENIAQSALKTCSEIILLKLQYTLWGFPPDRSTTDQRFTLQQMFETSSEYAKKHHSTHERMFYRHPRGILPGPWWKALKILQSKMLIAASHWPSTHWYPVQKLISVSAESNH